MVNLLQTVLTYTLIPVTATIASGAIAAFRPPGAKLRSFVQHFAAGVVFAAAASELLPDIVPKKSPLAVMIGGTLGVVVLLSVKSLTNKAQGSVSLIATVGLDVLIDGFILGLGFAAGAKAGILLTIALTLELLFLGLSVSATLSQASSDRKKIITITAGLALLLPVGATLGTALAGLSGFILAALLAFGLVALLYLVTEELLVEAHELPDTPLTAATFFVGFLLLILIEEITL